MKYLSLGLPDGSSITPPGSIPHGGLTFLQKVFGNAYTIILLICIAVSLIYIVLAGMQWITSGGDKNKLEVARRRLTWAIVGLIIGFLSFFIVNVIGNIFGVDLLKISL